jgi:hypothetical protein
MTNLVSTAVMVVALTLSASMASAITGAQLEKLCNSWTVDASLAASVGPGKTYENLDGFRNATWCQAYIGGYGAGIKGAMGADDKGIMGTYTIEQGVTPPQVVKVFKQYIANHPEEENKPAGDVLYHAMTSSGLLTVVVEKKSGDQ